MIEQFQIDMIRSQAKQGEQLKDFEEAKKKLEEFQENMDKMIEKKTKASFVDRKHKP